MMENWERIEELETEVGKWMSKATKMKKQISDLKAENNVLNQVAKDIPRMIEHMREIEAENEKLTKRLKLISMEKP